MRHPLLSHGLSSDLADWLLARKARFIKGRAPAAWRLRYQAFWFERLLGMQERAVAQRHSESASTYHFIHGFWRSGTTLLHNRLYAGWRCTVPLTWQCFSPASFFLQTPPQRDAHTRRPMDFGEIHTLGPQEDEFALLLLGEPSLYRALLDPAELDDPAKLFTSVGDPNLGRWQAFTEAVGANGPSPVLLKSPGHIFRLSALDQHFPAARQVWIGRSFGDVLRSNRRMWRAMTDLHSVTAPRPEAIDRFLVAATRRYKAVLEGMLALPRKNVMWITYESLRESPDELTAKAAAFLGFEPRVSAETVTADATVRPSSLPTNEEEALPTDLAEAAPTIDRLHRQLAQLHGPT